MWVILKWGEEDFPEVACTDVFLSMPDAIAKARELVRPGCTITVNELKAKIIEVGVLPK